MRIVEQPTEYHIQIPFDRFKTRNTNKVRLIPNVKFNYVRKVWIAPLNSVQDLLQLQIDCKAEWVSLDTTPQVIGEIPELPDLEVNVELKKGAMWDYQRKGVARGLQLKRFINGDDPGLGKTLQSLATIHIGNQIGEVTFPCLVICPSALKINWQREWEQWTGRKAMILDDKIKDTWHRFHELGMADIFICNYESLKKFFVDYYPPKGKMRSSADIKMNPRVQILKSVIIDESHKCKDPGAQQTKIALQICIGKEWVILLTGTPVVSKPKDLFPQLAIMGRLKEFGGKKYFMERYCEGGNGSANLKELNYRLNLSSFFRREKKDVLKDLPDKQRQTILCDITTRKEYEFAKNNLAEFLESKGYTSDDIATKMDGEILVKMNELKRISAMGKLNEVREFVDSLVESNQKIILFCNLHAIVDEIKRIYPNAVTVTGRDNQEEKQSSIDKFQNDPSCLIIVCNIKAAGVGITLTASSRVAFIEYPWTYADCVQCEDRAHRMGQKDSVMCTYFLGQNTIDEDLYDMIQEKRHTANSITGASDQMEMSFVNKMVNILKH